LAVDTASIDAIFAAYSRDDGPGCALGVVEGGRLAYARGYGVANLEYGVAIRPSSVFHVASVSKQFTAFALGLLVADGRLSWQDPVRRYVPELGLCAEGVRLRHLALHTSGLRDQWDLLELAGWRDGDVKTNQDVLALAARQRVLNFAPGTQHLYSNTGYTLLALVVERVSGQTFAAFCAERIFVPLGMTRSHFHDDHRTVVPGRAYAYRALPGGGHRLDIPDYDTVGATSLFTSVEDLGRWAAHLRRPAFGTAVVEEMSRPGALDDGTPLEYGLGLRIALDGARRTVGHSGLDNGYRAQLTWYPDDDVAVIVLANAAAIDPQALAARVARAWLGDAPPPDVALAANPAPPPGLPAGARPCDGLYWNAERALALTVGRDGADLLVAATGLSAIRLRAVGDGLYESDGPARQVRCEPALAAVPDRLSLAEGSEGPIAFAHEPAVAPAAEALQAYAGRYRASELGAECTLEVRGDRLVWVRPRFPEEALSALVADAFAADPGTSLVFERSPSGEVGAFLLFTRRVWRLRFERYAFPAT
jgi:CubicO group peptidase (beta-lactamase class C family)